MSRATLTDLQNLGLPASVLNALAGGTVQQQAALDAASAQVDSYLSAQYTLPLATYGKDIVQAEVNLASWQLLTSRGFNPDAGVDKGIQARYDTTLKWLEGIASGDVFPNVTDSSSGTSGAAGAFVSTSPPRGWTSTEPRGIGFWNQDWLDD